MNHRFQLAGWAKLLLPLLLLSVACSGLPPKATPLTSELVTTIPLPSTPATQTPEAATTMPPATALLPTLTPPLPPTQVPITASSTPAAPVEISIDEMEAELEMLLSSGLPTPEAGNPGAGGFDGLKAQYLPASGDPPLWAIHSYGFRSFDPPQSHFVAIYRHQENGWWELGRLELQNADILSELSLRQELLGDGTVWLSVNSGAGAHGGCYDLLRFDGTALLDMISHCHSSSPISRGIGDYNGDGQPDLILNETIDYVFCYACSVRFPMMVVLTWNGREWIQVDLTRLPESSAPDMRIQNDRAVTLAQAGLWQEAAALANQLETKDPVAIWNRTLINLQVEDLQEQVANSPYPLLAHLFYGDYGAVLELMRPYGAAALFSQANPLVAGTVAEGWEAELSSWLLVSTSAALDVRPELATAHFLRGWALYLTNPGDPEALDAVETAADLVPEETLFIEGVAYLRGE